MRPLTSRKAEVGNLAPRLSSGLHYQQILGLEVNVDQVEAVDVDEPAYAVPNNPVHIWREEESEGKKEETGTTSDVYFAPVDICVCLLSALFWVSSLTRFVAVVGHTSRGHTGDIWTRGLGLGTL